MKIQQKDISHFDGVDVGEDLVALQVAQAVQEQLDNIGSVF